MQGCSAQFPPSPDPPSDLIRSKNQIPAAVLMLTLRSMEQKLEAAIGCTLLLRSGIDSAQSLMRADARAAHHSTMCDKLEWNSPLAATALNINRNHSTNPPSW